LAFKAEREEDGPSDLGDPRVMKIDEKIKQRIRLACESRQPSEGVWYVVYLKPKWILRAYKEIEFKGVEHVDIWEKDVSVIVAEHYKVSQEEVALHPYGFPRGRVVNLNPSKKEIATKAEMYGSQWAVYHGDDLPGGTAKWQRQIVGAFDLAPAIGRINWRFDNHEIRTDYDVEALSALLGLDVSKA